MVTVEKTSDTLLVIVVPLIPWALIFGVTWYFVYRLLRRHARGGGEPVRVVLVREGDVAAGGRREELGGGGRGLV